MRTLFTTIMIFGFFLLSSSQDISVILKEAEKLEFVPNELAAYYKLKEALKIQPNQVNALSKCSELCSRIGSREKDAKKRDSWFSAALGYANKAVSISPSSDRANVSLAMVLGKNSLSKSGKEKIKNADKIKKLCELALRTNPNNYLAWHILGRWNYEISGINPFERAAAKLFFGGLPQGSLNNAILYFEKTKSLMPNFILNYLELAKAYHKDGQTSKAIGLLKSIQSFSNLTEDDSNLKANGLKFIAEWQ